ncbi:DUF4397 domain-containing protein [Chitinophaga pendula]|uniref:DUF4397 domain-containing protein n=1 Tax=Chitinophaga TaxID=79328 RepID=UPI000BAF1136|nr:MULTISPECIES: DUF4397 domain-containing protein [Chitinophaga]ASZ09652.1 hypothetical protein CK934_01015 [Chitinophaga sp. MD30]UCJ07414.1 DUF4397 domain-containing protein [Chitinophaga pendula]
MTIQSKYSLCLIAILLLLGACKKDKLNYEYDNRPLKEPRKKSNVRIINLADYNQVVANGDTLTNFVVRRAGTPNENDYPGTTYFPTNGRLSKIWEVPQDVFDAREKANLTICNWTLSGVINMVRFTTENSYSRPLDYILPPAFAFKGQPEVVPVPRDVSAPSKPDHFKIRIINLTGAINSPGSNVNGPIEDLQGPVTLSYADGTPVDTKTSHIASANPVSGYVEVPYGTYQFKVLTEDGRTLPAISQDAKYSIIEPVNSSVLVRYNKPINQIYAPIKTYQPGGIYTVIVTPQNFRYYTNERDQDATTYQNGFQIINDNSLTPNTTYCRLQTVNAWKDQPVTIRTNGREIATGLTFGKAGAYANLVNGHHKIEAIDANGKVIATTEQLLRPAQNYTAWLYPTKEGDAKLLIVANDLSGMSYNGSSEDATYDRFQYDYIFNQRFLNLSPDNPYVSFTKDNGIALSLNASINLQPGIPLEQKPYITMGYDMPRFNMMAYRSLPDVVPGIWADDIPVRGSEDFIANKTLYTNINRPLPTHEPGIYTVALIGRTGNATPKATIMILKHNK